MTPQPGRFVYDLCELGLMQYIVPQFLDLIGKQTGLRFVYVHTASPEDALARFLWERALADPAWVGMTMEAWDIVFEFLEGTRPRITHAPRGRVSVCPVRLDSRRRRRRRSTAR